MRISTWLRLVGLGILIANAPGCSDADPVYARGVPPGAGIVQEKFHGYGLTPKEAEANALECACDWLAVQANLSRPPSPDYLREKHMVHFVGEPKEQEFEVAKDFSKDGKMKVVTLHLNVTAEQARDLQKQGQQQRMKERQKQSLLGLIGAMGLICVMGGYLRLEEATKGYYTRLLRIAAIATFIAIVAGLNFALEPLGMRWW